MQFEQYNDRELVVLALLNNQQAFSSLMQRHKEALNSYIQHQFPVGEAAEDLLLIIFDKAFRNLKSYNAKFAFTTWLYTISDNTCIDFIRKKRTLAHTLRQVSQKWDDYCLQTLSSFSDPESEMIASQEAAQLLHYINLLKPIYREPARLRFLHDYPYEEIALELSIPKGTVKTRIHRAKEILAKWITL
jgi:RNA polymerase sigma-70 factor (ECF subfamily)